MPGAGETGVNARGKGEKFLGGRERLFYAISASFISKQPSKGTGEGGGRVGVIQLEAIKKLPPLKENVKKD